MDQQAPPIEEPTARQDKATHTQSKNRYKTWSIILGSLLVMSLVGAGILGYRYMDELVTTAYLKQDKAELSKQVTSLEERMVSDGGKNGPSGQVALTDREQAEFAASAYYCNIKGFGCDKVAASVTKIQPATATSAAFAIVKAGSSEGATNFYVKSIDGVKWTVIYDGQNTPPQEIIDKFEIPSDFAQ